MDTALSKPLVIIAFISLLLPDTRQFFHLFLTFQGHLLVAAGVAQCHAVAALFHPVHRLLLGGVLNLKIESKAIREMGEAGVHRLLLYFSAAADYTTCRCTNSLRSFSIARRFVMVTLPVVQPSSRAISVTESWRKNSPLITVCSLGRSSVIHS